MAFTTTTLSAACAANDTTIKVTSATGFTKGRFVRVDDEFFQISETPSGTRVAVTRGQNGTVQAAHVVNANATVGDGSDFANPAPTQVLGYPLGGRDRRVTTYSASGAIALPTPGTDAVAIIQGTSVRVMTVADPTADMDGCLLWIATSGVAAHTVDFASGLSGEGGSYNILTLNSNGRAVLGPFMAINLFWQAPVAVAMTGTVSDITAGLA